MPVIEIMDVRGASIWTTRHGDGLPLLLSSGGPGCCDYMGPVSSMLDDMAQVIRWEQRGCGRSTLTPPYDLETCIADMESLRQQFGFDRWLVGGHSWGANLSLAYSLKHPERTMGLIYLAGTGITEDWKPEYRQNRDTQGESKPKLAYPPNLEVNRVGNISWQAFLRQDTLPIQLQALEVPAIVVCGQKDIRPNWPSEDVVRLLPQATFELIMGAEHYFWLTHANQLELILRDFLARNFLSSEQ